MKKIFILATILLCSCSTDKSLETLDGTADTNLKEIIDVYNDTDPFWEAEYAKHRLEVGISEDNLILVSNINGVLESFFMVQLEGEDLQKVASLESGMYEIANFMDELIISNKENTYYFSTLSTPILEDVYLKSTNFEVKSISDNYLDQENLTGRAGFKDLDLTELPERVRCKCVSKLAYEYCESGGEGANGCSISGGGESGGCSISCSEKYYACCNKD